MRRGLKEAREGIARLQSLWPAAFPAKTDMVRPLALGIVAVIADVAGWDRSYARAVVRVWKTRSAYCEAVLRFDRRFNLNGEPVDEPVSDEAREQARRRLADRAARVRGRQEEMSAGNPDLSVGLGR